MWQMNEYELESEYEIVRNANERKKENDRNDEKRKKIYIMGEKNHQVIGDKRLNG